MYITWKKGKGEFEREHFYLHFHFEGILLISLTGLQGLKELPFAFAKDLMFVPDDHCQVLVQAMPSPEEPAA